MKIFVTVEGPSRLVCDWSNEAVKDFDRLVNTGTMERWLYVDKKTGEELILEQGWVGDED